MKKVAAAAAIAAIPTGSRVVLPQGSIEPRALFDALAASRGHPGDPATLYSGLQFGDYAFLGDVRAASAGESGFDVGGLGPGYRYVTWQVGGSIRSLVRAGRIGILPLRFRDIPRTFGAGGVLQADVAMIQCTPPRGGRVSLGIACSIFPSMVAAARCVVAEIHPDMPWTSGATEIPVEEIDLAVDATGPLGILPRPEADDVDRAIVTRVVDLVPERPWIQLGVGAIPDSILQALSLRPDVRFHSGMLSDPLLDFLERAPSDASVVVGELAGSLEMYRRAAADPRVVFRTTDVTHHLPYLATLERFVSINSAIEVDLTGQVNGATLGGVPVSGVGGSLDFVEGSRYSPGGISIVALRATARGRSRIVPRLPMGNIVTLPQFTVDAVVTEHGVARLTGLELRERAEALIAIAAPGHRDELRAQAEALRAPR